MRVSGGRGEPGPGGRTRGVLPIAPTKPFTGSECACASSAGCERTMADAAARTTREVSIPFFVGGGLLSKQTRSAGWDGQKLYVLYLFGAFGR